MNKRNFEVILNQLQINIYVTNIHTNEIIFMNKKMKEEYNILDPEGKVCWQVLYPEKISTCSFCKVLELLKNDKKGVLIKWYEKCNKLNRVFENYDSLITWQDGTVVHMHQSIDIANSTSLNKPIKINEFHEISNNKEEKGVFNFSRDNFDYNSTLLYDALIRGTDEYIYICNMKTGVFRYSPSQVELFDLPGEIVENPLVYWKKIVHPEDWNRFYKSNTEIGKNQMDYHTVEFRAKNRSGEYIWLRCRGQLMRDEFGEPSIFAGIMTQLGKQNKIDSLTQLLNYHEFMSVFEDKISNPMIEKLCIVLLNIDDFKNVNEMYDRDFGDNIIKTLAQSIQSILPDNAELYKLDGDEMGILVDNVEENEILTLYNQIQNMIIHLQLWRKYGLNITISAGCVIYPKHGDTVKELYKCASYSLQYAKEHGKNRLVFFSQEILKNKMYSLEMMRDLKASINDDFRGFSLRFQPQVDTESHKIIGVEVLLRWTNDKCKAISPLEFIPILEENDMINIVGAWVLRMALRTFRKWIDYYPFFKVSVNVSAVQILEDTFIEDIVKIIDDENFPYQNLVLELTESHTVQNMSILQFKFKALQDLGIYIAMDDFGTGYSSLEVLKFSPIDIVKIDRVFVKDILKSKFDATFIHFIVAICHDVGIKVCLEGVETQEEYDLVKQIKPDYIQGYLFGKPQTATEIFDLLKLDN
ncbi:signaling protein [Clostridioides difficile]|uniref:c-di-GMP phosphodiesterase PdcA n=1 Tax=Clostridioides difficile TaxID=1496 RepID=UPI000E5125E2|nr:c-di-GMP phosphodiesterase PdcA [Clostridioides difficile]AXU75224.1 signaling protein [Clostridioides difficile]MDL0418181.1 c-di-GMP phosphodiesterase PdcA [Clostridioides difficile]VIB43608.1 diguanylate kinase signaling protein [Clostridioides difficile]